MTPDLSVLYEDELLLAVAKPAGLSTQAPAIAGTTLETVVRRYLGGEGTFVGTLHRLDRPVSGVVLWAKTPGAARAASRQFERRQVRKCYWAVVERGNVPLDELWEDWLIREDTGLKRVQTAAPSTPRAQFARTQVLRQLPLTDGLTWLELVPETGRMHQLRVQAGARGCPILGDTLYRSTRPFHPEAIALHARRLELAHPLSRERLIIEAPPPENWRRFECGW